MGVLRAAIRQAAVNSALCHLLKPARASHLPVSYYCFSVSSRELINCYFYQLPNTFLPPCLPPALLANEYAPHVPTYKTELLSKSLLLLLPLLRFPTPSSSPLSTSSLSVSPPFFSSLPSPITQSITSLHSSLFSPLGRHFTNHPL
ncbi:hypothetical protein E2C01_069515 [Portunus trituberculatus]|uniref:Uncharacterized protein n=1 Tax=Portunus trituberculatus TaxID=210409 RepID=A0A5B7HRR0_PORTR|nr:hypothetical protein [Portunus trituberculatus]